jgi:myotubularin-related protein 3/4
VSLENTKWLHYISGLLKSALVVVNAIDKDQKPVLVHCSDGWDRTPQIVALAELILDPYYRTIEVSALLLLPRLILETYIEVVRLKLSF